MKYKSLILNQTLILKKPQSAPQTSILWFSLFILSQCTIQGPTKVILLKEGEVLVQSGDTIYGLAEKHGVSVRALIEQDHLIPPYLLKENQKLHLPTVVEIPHPVPDPTPIPESPQLIAPQDSVQEEWSTLSEDDVLVEEEESPPSKRLMEAAEDFADEPPQKKSPPQIVWQKPIAGATPHLLKEKNPSRGVQFYLKKKTPVYASGSGIVISVGAFDGQTLQKNKSFIIVKHPFGKDYWATVYGPFATTKVNANEKVTSHTVLGLAEGPHLTFQLWKNKKALNPLPYLTE